MKNGKVMLAYGFNEEEKQKIDNFIEETKLPRCKNINEAMGKMKLKDIVEGIKLEVFNCKIPKERVILFHSFSDIEINKTITFMKNNLDSVPIFAVITPISIEWTFEELINHLIEERNWFNTHK